MVNDKNHRMYKKEIVHCAVCPACVEADLTGYMCNMTHRRRLYKDMGFPEWCPLEIVRIELDILPQTSMVSKFGPKPARRLYT